MPAAGELIVDLNVIAQNWLSLWETCNAAGSKTCQVSAVVKADAYGLGMEKAAVALYQAGCRIFFVANIAEAVALAKVLPDKREIYSLQGFCSGEEAALPKYDIKPVVVSAEMLGRWSSLVSANPALKCALKVNTGMNRLGLDESGVLSLASDDHELSRLNIDLVMSHLACADDAASPMNSRQRQSFERIVQFFRENGLDQTRFSLANSAGIFLGEDFQYDIVRPGIVLYSGMFGSSAPPAVSGVFKSPVGLKLPILQTRRLAPGACVGYGAAYEVKAETTIATVAGGYADGVLRSSGGKITVQFRGEARPVVGRISMDSFAVDLGDVDPESIESFTDAVILFADSDSLGAVAEGSGTISYELLTALGTRYTRKYLELTNSVFHGR